MGKFFHSLCIVMQEEIGCFIFPEKTLTELSYKISEHILMHCEHKGAAMENTISVSVFVSSLSFGSRN